MILNAVEVMRKTRKRWASACTLSTAHEDEDMKMPAANFLHVEKFPSIKTQSQSHCCKVASFNWKCKEDHTSVIQVRYTTLAIDLFSAAQQRQQQNKRHLIDNKRHLIDNKRHLIDRYAVVCQSKKCLRNGKFDVTEKWGMENGKFNKLKLYPHPQQQKI